MRALRGGNAAAVLAAINPIVRVGELLPGAASSRTFAALDHYLWQLTYKWACYSHANKPKPWIVSRYYGRFNPASQDRWVFGDRDSGAYLPGSPGPRSSGIAWSWARRPRTTPP